MTQRHRVETILKDRGNIGTTDMLSPTLDGGLPILRLGARIEELRRDGWLILTARQSNGTARYRLLSEPTVTPARPTVDLHNRMVADLTDAELERVFPGSVVEAAPDTPRAPLPGPSDGVADGQAASRVPPEPPARLWEAA